MALQDQLESLKLSLIHISWGPPTAESALSRWWDREKKLFDYLRGKGISTRNQMDEYIAKNPDEINKLGFGLSLIHILRM